MKKIVKTLSLVLTVFILALELVCCNGGGEKQSDGIKDYASSVKLDMSSAATVKAEVTVKAFVDGDTTHFNVPESVSESGVLKARYLGINTPESTGKIEEWGKAASVFTKSKLKDASSIVIESDDDKWTLDATGGRYLVWIWYRPDGTSDYRNLNIEILQNGLALASNSANNRYGDTCIAALNQAKSQKLCIYSGEKDPDFYYGEAYEITLKELRCNLDGYTGKKVALDGVITKNSNNSVYIEDYDAETDMYYGMTVYYGFGLNGNALEILSVGNKARIVGTVQYYETGDSYQISGLTYRSMKPDDPNNIQKISSGNAPAYVPTSADTFVNGKVKIDTEDGEKTFDYAELVQGTSVEMKNLKVRTVYTTVNEDSSSKGAMTIVCESDGVEVTLRTAVLYDGDKLVDHTSFDGKMLDVRGIAEKFQGKYQIKILSLDDITIKN